MKILASNFRNKRLAFEHFAALRKRATGFTMVCANTAVSGFVRVAGEHKPHVIGVYSFCLGKQNQSLYNIAQLAYISRPGIVPQLFNRFLIKRFLFPTVLRSNLTRKMRNQFGHVFFSFAQWRDTQRENVNPVEEILPEAIFFNEILQITVRGYQYADIYADRVV